MARKHAGYTIYLIVMTTFLWLAGIAVARAHGGLASAVPVPNEPVVNPTEVRLGFSEEITEGSSIQVVSWESFKEVQQGPTQIDPAQPTVAFVALATPLAVGRYSVNWYAVMVDGASAEGSYEFDVVAELPAFPPPDAATTVPAQAPSTTATAPRTPLVSSRTGVLTALGVTLGLLLVLLLLFMRPVRR